VRGRGSTPSKPQPDSAAFLVVPEAGIKGNSLVMMTDRSNLQVAAVIQKWIDAKVGKR